MADATRDLNAAQHIAKYYTSIQYIMVFKQFFISKFIVRCTGTRLIYIFVHSCLVLLLTGPKTFCASPNFLSQLKNLTAFSPSSKTFVPAQKTILLNANHLFVWHKKFGQAQNILGLVKGQGIKRIWYA